MLPHQRWARQRRARPLRHRLRLLDRLLRRGSFDRLPVVLQRGRRRATGQAALPVAPGVKVDLVVRRVEPDRIARLPALGKLLGIRILQEGPVQPDQELALGVPLDQPPRPLPQHHVRKAPFVVQAGAVDEPVQVIDQSLLERSAGEARAIVLVQQPPRPPG